MLIIGYTSGFVQFDESWLSIVHAKHIYFLVLDSVLRYWHCTQQYSMESHKRYSSFSLTPTSALFHSCLQSCKGSIAGDKKVSAKVRLVFEVFAFGLLFIRHIAFRNYKAGART